MFNGITALFTDYTFRQALIGTVAVGGIAGALGPAVYLRRHSLLADTIAHSTLPGMLSAFVLASLVGLPGRFVPILLLGAVITGLVSVVCVFGIGKLAPIKPDAAMAATLTTFFALGMMILQYITRAPLPGKAGIADYLLGNASTLTMNDVISILATGAVTLGFLVLIHRIHATSAFDPVFATINGISTRVVDALAFIALVMVTVIGVKVVGVVLMVSVIIAPTVAARKFTRRLVPFIVMSSVLGMVSSAVGCYVSITTNAPTGPCIVLCHTVVVTIAIVWSRRRDAFRQNAAHVIDYSTTAKEAQPCPSR